MACERLLRMRILITGGAGFIGSHIADQYIALGHEVAIADSLWNEGGGKTANIPPAARLYQVDISDTDTLTRIFDEFKPEIVNHHAAQHSVAVSTTNPQLDAQVNVIGLINILTQSKRIEARKIIFASSGATYGTPIHLPVDEDTPQRPESPYGITKLIGEYYLRYWSNALGLKFTALRYGNVYGPRQDPHGEAGVVSIFARRFLAHEGVRIDWDGEQSKDYVYVDDVAQANVQALNRGDNESFCIGTGRATSINELYRILADLTGFEAPITRAAKRQGDIYKTFFDSNKAERILAWKPTVTFEAGVKATLDYLRP